MQQHFTNFLIVSVAYIVAFSLTLGFVVPLQTMLLANVPITISLLFLPHGVRILAFYFFDWKAIFYLMPASFLMIFLSMRSGVPVPLESAIISICACYVGYRLGTLVVSDDTNNFGKQKWKFFLFVGTLSSILNGAAFSIVKGSVSAPMTTLGYVIGDMAGLMVAFYVLIMVFRWARLFPRAND